VHDICHGGGGSAPHAGDTLNVAGEYHERPRFFAKVVATKLEFAFPSSLRFHGCALFSVFIRRLCGPGSGRLSHTIPKRAAKSIPARVNPETNGSSVKFGAKDERCARAFRVR
jgi:hypothetical protein